MPDKAAEVEFFGIRLKVSNTRLASLLNSNVTDDVVVIADRALALRRTSESEPTDEGWRMRPSGGR
jgi:hypothetical protein